MATIAAADDRTDAEGILQALLNAPQLTRYYHFDARPERRPLRLANASGADLGTPRLTAGGDAVSIVQGGDPAAVEVTRLAIAGDRAEIAFSYRPEGLVGEGSFRRASGGWTVDRLEIGER